MKIGIVLLAIAVQVVLSHPTAEPAKNEGKSAQHSSRTSSNNNRVSFRRGGDDDDRDHNDRNLLLAATPQPHLLSVTPSGLLSGGNIFGSSTGLLADPLDPFNRYSSGTSAFLQPNPFQLSQFGGGLQSSQFLLAGRDPNYVLSNPQVLVLEPRLALMHAGLFFQYPQLRHYVSQYVLDLIEGRSSTGLSSRLPFQRIFPSTFGDDTFGGFSGNSVLDFNRPIDVNRPILTTVSPLGFANSNRRIRF